MRKTPLPRHHPAYSYPGLYRDLYGGMTDIGAIIKDAWVLGLLDESEDGRGWPLAKIRELHARVEAAWAPYEHQANRLPPVLRDRYLRIHEAAAVRSRDRGWAAGHFG
jgi:hypothetical protein